MSAIFTDYQKTGIKGVDMVAACVSHFRKINKPIKTVYIHPGLYNQFERWVSKQMSEESFEEARKKGFQFDGVNVNEASVVAGTDIYWDLYNE